MKIDIMRGKGHKKYVLALNEKRNGMKDGYGYTILDTFEVPDEEVRALLSQDKEQAS